MSLSLRPPTTHKRVFTLRSRDLLTRYGFCEGDMLEDWLRERVGRDGRPAVDYHTLLVAVVKEYLVPVLEPLAVVEIVDTPVHNPIRVVRIGNRDWTHQDELKGNAGLIDTYGLLQPESVEVSETQVAAVYERLCMAVHGYHKSDDHKSDDHEDC